MCLRDQALLFAFYSSLHDSIVAEARVAVRCPPGRRGGWERVLFCFGGWPPPPSPRRCRACRARLAASPSPVSPLCSLLLAAAHPKLKTFKFEFGQGRYDSGIVTLRPTSSQLLETRTVYTDPTSGAPARRAARLPAALACSLRLPHGRGALFLRGPPKTCARNVPAASAD